MYPGSHAVDRPDHPAVVMARSGEVQTYSELDERSSKLAAHWRSIGLTEGDHIAIFMENQIRFMEVVWSAMRSGLYVTAINSYLSPPEVAYIIEDCLASAVVTSRARAEVATEVLALGTTPRVTEWLMADGPAEGFGDLDAVIDASPRLDPDLETAGLTMLYSSGSTGRPKGILRPLPPRHPGDSDVRAERLAAVYDYGPDMVYLSPAPMYHAAPLAFVLGVHRHGGTVVMMERFDAAESLDLIERHRVTHSQWVPTMFVRMLKLDPAEREAHDLSTHRVAIHAAAPCPVAVKQQMIEWWGPILMEYYAGSEGLGSTIVTSEDWLRKPGTVGRSGDSEIVIADEDGNALPPGEIGTVYFRGNAGFEYHNAPEKTADSKLDAHTATLGDVGYVDEDGYLFLTDRKAYMIISGGVNIYPQEVEDCLVLHPDVADVAVFGVPDAEMGEQVKAVVQLAEGVEASDELERRLIAYSRDHLAHFKCPKSVDFTDELPRLPTGKLYKRLLRDRYWGKHDSTIV